MRRLFLLACAIAISACGSDSATAPPSDATSFAGTWDGLIAGFIPIIVVATQSGTVITGTAHFDEITDTTRLSMYGLASHSALSMGLDATVDSVPYHADVNGVFVTSDSVEGTFTARGDEVSIELKRR